jgi:transcriptional regulator GlxA family with amidase domain
MTISVAIVVFPGVQALDVAGPMDVFTEANRFLLPDQHYQVRTIGTVEGAIRCSNGLALMADAYYRDVGEAPDLLLIAGGPGLPKLKPEAALCEWLVAHANRAKRYGSVCNGAFLLGHAGLLDGKAVTTHWNDAPALARRFEKTRVDLDRIYLKDGALYTSAGVTAGIDLSLYLLSEDYGAEVSLNVAKRLVVFTQRRGGQSQFSPYLTPFTSDVSPVGLVQQYVLAHLNEALDVGTLAGIANMSARNFARVFARDAKVTPAQFIEGARVDAARVMLESGSDPLKTVAYRCGFADASHMRSVFARRLGVSPKQYREHFRSPAGQQAGRLPEYRDGVGAGEQGIASARRSTG